jgi:hypothetical protein
MHKSATKCNETVGKWCKNKHGASKIIDTLEMYHPSRLGSLPGVADALPMVTVWLFAEILFGATVVWRTATVRGNAAIHGVLSTRYHVLPQHPCSNSASSIAKLQLQLHMRVRGDQHSLPTLFVVGLGRWLFLLPSPRLMWCCSPL